MRSKTEIFIDKTGYPISLENIDKDINFSRAYMNWLNSKIKLFKILNNLNENEGIYNLSNEFIEYIEGLKKEDYRDYQKDRWS